MATLSMNVLSKFTIISALLHGASAFSNRVPTANAGCRLFHRRIEDDCSSTQLCAKKKRKTSGSNSSGGGGFGAVKEKGPPTKKQILKRVEQTYGGTTPQQIAQATQEKIQKQIRSQPPPVQMALQLYQQLQQWDAHLSRMSLLQQSQLDPSEMEGAKRARNELDKIFQENSNLISCDQDLHNLLQQFTWDASADAKAARAVTGDMNAEISGRIEKACAIVADAVRENGLCLDVGCGFGVLIPFLLKAGIPAVNIHGVDLSPEMIRNAKEQHAYAKDKSPTFTACDFINDYDGPDNGATKFQSIVFCSCLHDLPDPTAALTKATSLLEEGGKIVIVHAQGASHVLKQVESNPVLVQRGLPTSSELEQLPQLRLFQEPADAATAREESEGYLAVLEKTA